VFSYTFFFSHSNIKKRLLVMEKIVWNKGAYIPPCFARAAIIPAICEKYMWSPDDFRCDFTSQNKVLKLTPSRHLLFEKCPNCLSPDFLFLSVSHVGDKGSLRLACSSCNFSDAYDRVLERELKGDEDDGDDNVDQPPAKRLCAEVGKDREFVFAQELQKLLQGNVIYVQKKHKGYYWVFHEMDTRTHKRGWRKDFAGMYVRESIQELLAPTVNENDQIVLQNTNVRNKICDEMKHLLRDDDNEFFKKQNGDQRLVGFENGVMDFREGCFRPIEKTDCVTWSTGCKFVELGEWSTMKKRYKDILVEILSFLNAIFLDDKEYFNLFLDMMASAYDGTKRKQFFFIWNGGKMKRHMHFLFDT